MKKFIKNTLIKLLSLSAVIMPLGKANAQEGRTEDHLEPKVGLSVWSNIEKNKMDPLYGELYMVPDASISYGQHKLEYRGLFWQSADMDGHVFPWWRLQSYVGYENDTGFIRAGRILTREIFTNAVTPNFDNLAAGKGVSWQFTGLYGKHKASGLGFGIVSDNNQMNPGDWDTGLITYGTQITPELSVQGHIAGTRSELTRYGVTVGWNPEGKFSTVGGIVYKGKAHTGFLTMEYRFSDFLRLYGGCLASVPREGKINGQLSTGLEYRVSDTGLYLFGGIQQEIGGQRETSGVVGIRWKGRWEIDRNGGHYRD